MSDTMKNDLLERVPFLMHRVVTAMVAAATASGAGGEFNIHSWRVMVALLNNPGMNVSDLCTLTRVDQTNMSHLLRRLLKQEVVTKRRSTADSRFVEVHLTAAGERLAADFAARTLQHQQVLLRGFSAEEATILRAFLVRMFENIDGAELG